MHLLIPVFFNASFGGVHENVRATALFMLSRRHRVSVVCRPGPFAEQLREQGAGVIETDYAEGSFAAALEEIEALHEQHSIDLVHAHPFAARRLGMIVAQVLGLPCVVTMHRKYVDALPATIDRLDAVFTVSEGIRHYLLTEGGIEAPEKLHMVPNTPDAKLFKSVKAAPPVEAEGRVVVSLVTRLDKDKAFILETFYQAVAHAAEHYSGRIHWQVVGQGTLQEAFAERVEALRGENSVSYTGWLQGEALRDAYCRSDMAMAAGRCALEALSCGTAVVALGANGYVGLVNGDTWQEAVYTNFGEMGGKQQDQLEGALAQDFSRMMASKAQRRRLGHFGRQLVRQFFDAGQMHRRLLGFYHLVVAAYQTQPRAPVPASEFLELRLRGLTQHRPEPYTLALEHQCEPLEGLSFAWYLYRNGKVIEKHRYRPEPRHRLTLPGPGRYKVRCFVKDEQGHKISLYGPEVEVGEG
uniref:glycosyltransferase family 4 protein n=1 Tax=uncultured Halomonas sp. TaxID=173971 RepID=UPI0026084584|nr:glycosyltransferase family 4 protein [uncultured Halomonas sp.]